MPTNAEREILFASCCFLCVKLHVAWLAGTAF